MDDIDHLTPRDDLSFSNGMPPLAHARPLRVALIDDHVLFRQGLCAILTAQPRLDVVLEAASAQDLAPIDDVHPDVAVVDIALRRSSGSAAIHEVLRRVPACKVLVLTAHADHVLVAEAFAAGASGFALKDQDASDVLAAIGAVAAGGRYLVPSLNGRPTEPATPIAMGSQPGATHGQPPGPTAIRKLSARERELFDLIVQGYSNRDIAELLHISVKTVEAHRVSINRKLDAHSTADLVRLAARHGMMPARHA